MNFNVFQPKLSEKNVACPHINFNILMFSTKDAIADKVSIVLGLFMCYLSRLSVNNSKLVRTGMQIGLKRPLCLSPVHQMGPKLIGICWKIGSIPS